ncbi:MAG: hypothetical protein H7Y00_09445 [Fimbriimonadaceae bacterium]|nr:hypothetical protein [Chitinophagales bacterium]
MKQLTILLLFFAFNVNAQLYLNDDKMYHDVLFQTSEYVYFKKNDTVYKVAPVNIKSLSGSYQTFPVTNYYDDMYDASATVQTGLGLILAGVAVTGVGFVLTAGDAEPNIILGISIAGGALSLGGFFTEIAGFSKMKRANNKMRAVEYTIK